MTFPRFLASGLDTADFVELSAPTPWLIEATEGDYFTPPGARLVYEEAEKWFALYGARERIGFFVGPGPHGVPLVSREAIYQWMIRWLKNGQGDYHEQPVELYTNSDLQVTSSGRVEDEPGSRKVHEFLRDDFQAGKRRRAYRNCWLNYVVLRFHPMAPRRRRASWTSPTAPQVTEST